MYRLNKQSGTFDMFDTVYPGPQPNSVYFGKGIDLSADGKLLVVGAPEWDTGSFFNNGAGKSRPLRWP